MEKRCPQSPEWISSGPTSEADHGFEFSELIVEIMAIEVVGQDTSSEVISLLLEDWEVGRVALSCHLSVDFLCQEMRGCVSAELRVSGFFLVLCVRSAMEVLWWKCHSSNAFFSPDGLGQQEMDVVRDTKEKERERRALLSCAGWPISFEIFGVGHGVPAERRCPFLPFLPPCGVCSSE